VTILFLHFPERYCFFLYLCTRRIYQKYIAKEGEKKKAYIVSRRVNMLVLGTRKRGSPSFGTPKRYNHACASHKILAWYLIMTLPPVEALWALEEGSARSLLSYAQKAPKGKELVLVCFAIYLFSA